MQVRYNIENSFFGVRSSNELRKRLIDFFGRHKFMPDFEESHTFVVVNFDVIALNTAQQIHNAACRLAQKQQLDAAYIYFNDALLAYPNLISAIQCKAQIEILRKQYDNAFDTCIDGLKLNPNDADLLALLGYTFKKQGCTESADKFFKNALSIDSENPLAMLNLRGYDVTLSIFDEIVPLYGNLIVKYEDLIQSPFLLAKALFIYDQGDDILRAYDIAVSASIWEPISSKGRHLGIEVLENAISILDKQLAEYQWNKIQCVLDIVEKQTGVRPCLVEQKNSVVPSAILDSDECVISYNPDKPFCYFHLVRNILRLRLEYIPANLYFFPEVSISDHSLKILYGRYYDFLLRGYMDLSTSPTKEVYVKRKLVGYIQSIANETINHIVDITIRKICPVFMPFMLGQYLSRLRVSCDTHKSWISDPLAPRSLLYPRRITKIVEAYYIQQFFGVITYPKFDPEDNELEDMQQLYDELAYTEVEINPMHYMKNAFDRYGLLPYVDIYPQSAPTGSHDNLT